MIPLDPRHHRALVDAHGNITIPDTPAASVMHTPRECAEIHKAWAVQPEEQTGDALSNHSAPKRVGALLHAARTAVHDATASMLHEGARQYTTSARGALQTLRSTGHGIRNIASRAWAFLTQPVWVVNRKQPRQYSRMTLFVLDVIRFGGTFAALFVALFATLNYQSFWDILQARLQPIRPVTIADTMIPGADVELAQKLLRSPSLAMAGRLQGDLLSFLPDVGPPENRIIIPKLNLNVPLVTPSFQNLLKEDWTGVEHDIQEALQQGVVHYPGTARPGQAGNFFVTGHSSYYPWAPGKYKTVFARLHELDVGDEYWVYYGGDRHRYRVNGKTEVKPTNVNVLDQPLDRRMATLMTCTPVGTTLRRLIITAEEVDPLTGHPLRVGEHVPSTMPKVRPEQLPI